VVAGTFSSRFEAELAAEYLVELGIPATVSTDDARGTIPTLQFAEGTAVEVAPEDLEQARQILRDYVPQGPVTKTSLSTRQRIQSIAVSLLFAAFVLSLVIYLVLNKLSPK